MATVSCARAKQKARQERTVSKNFLIKICFVLIIVSKQPSASNITAEATAYRGACVHALSRHKTSHS